MQKILLGLLAVAIVVGGGAFYGGMKYQANKTTTERQQMASARGGQQFGGRIGGRTGGANMVGGEIIAKDDPAPEQARYGASKSITVKLRDGGSKIVFYSEATAISKSVQGSAADLAVGQSVTVGGKANSDGSVTAESIQLRSQPGD